MPDKTINYVDSAAKLADLCEQLASADALALDTEFTREKTYYAHLGLIQIASHDIVACIDPLVVTELQPLLQLLQAPHITKIIHSARQDLEVIWQNYQIMPQPLFDTQVAASLLGIHEQISYAALVEQLLQVSLDKAHTRTDWCQRPLSPAQINYAADDVRYLIALYPILRDRLNAKQRLHWLEQEGQSLCHSERYQVKFNLLWQQVSGQQRLNPAQLAILRALSAWREQRAQRLNRPRQWIVRDEVLIDLCMMPLTTLSDLQASTNFPASLIDSAGDELITLINEARALPADAWPIPSSRDTFNAEQKKLVTTLSNRVRELADSQGICATLIAPRKELERLVCGNRDSPLFQGWRKEIVGQQLAALLP